MQWNCVTLAQRLSRRPSLLLWVVVAAFVPLRLALASTVGISPDEAYYFDWSRHLDIGYPDHPPAIAWLIALSTTLGGDSQLALRIPAVVLGGVVLPLVLYWLGREVGLDRKLAGVLVLASLVQPLGIAAGLTITPDVPLIVCWIASAALVLRAARSDSVWWWLLAGLAAGCALLSKHSGWILIASVGGGLLVDSRSRLQLKRVGPWLGLATALVVASPNLLWDAIGGFPSLSFQLHHGFSPVEMSLAPLRFAEFIGGQAALLTPLVAWAVLWALYKGRGKDTDSRLLWAMAVLPIVVFGGASLFAHPEANWPAPAHPLLIALALSRLKAERTGSDKSESPKHGRYVIAAVVTSALLTAAGALHLLSPLPFFPPEREPAARLRAWHDIPNWLTAAENLPLSADDYELAAALSYQLRSHPNITVRCGRTGQCESETIALVSSPGDTAPDPPSWFSHPDRRVIESNTSVMRREDGEVVRTLRAFRLERDQR